MAAQNYHMIPLIDMYLRSLIQEKFEWLKTHPDMIPKIFGTLGNKITLNGITKFVTERDVKTLIGFPQSPQQIPCFVILLQAENEIPLGLGDNIDGFEALGDGPGFVEEWDDEDITTQYVLTGIDMKSSYRIECWSDNGDLTGYMYNIAKWALLSSRKEMLNVSFKLPSLSGTDLEPVPDYMPIFIYRRSLVITFQYENVALDDETIRGEGDYQFPIGITRDDIHIKANPMPGRIDAPDNPI